MPAAVLGTTASSSNLSAGPRKVRLSDRELLQRVQRVAVPNGPVNLRVLSPRRGWKRVRTGTGGMNVHYRLLRTATPNAPFETQQCQVVVGGDIRARTSELLSLLRAPTEKCVLSHRAVHKSELPFTIATWPHCSYALGAASALMSVVVETLSEVSGTSATPA
ncbi:hypothetical protein BBJ29_005320 [Phytophthora kernoviae]|uniref:Uncharacterized protein n=1 Tax=Phytophthora kernoviae TaxID=325452 RepID=A0A3F2RQ93_9STRA|nr:hypothetical protein BBJ29_005320 [Phytophthora kernoviae]RLN62162.1 hypothetical protein BBP00_00004939 [Phytophthora kernoviae]